MLPAAALSGSRPECAGQASSSPRGARHFALRDAVRTGVGASASWYETFKGSCTLQPQCDRLELQKCTLITCAIMTAGVPRIFSWRHQRFEIARRHCDAPLAEGACD